MKKRVLSFVLALIMVIGLLPTASFAAAWTEGVPTVSLSSEGLINNNEIEVVLNVSSSTVAIGAFDFGVTYDADLVEPNTKKGDVDIFELEETVGIATTASVSDSIQYNYTKNSKAMFYVSDTKTKGFGKSGFTFTFYFKVKDSALASGGAAVFGLDSDVYALTDLSGDNSAAYPTSNNSVSVAIPIKSAAVSGAITTPANGAADASSVSGTGLTANVSWSPALTGGKFVDNTAYTATVTVTPAGGYAFADNATVSGLDGFTFSKQANGSYTASKTYEKTAKNDSVVTSVEVADNTIAIPTAVEATKTVTMTATVKDQYGDAMNGQTVEWSIPTTAGASIAAATGIVTVQPTATAGAVTVTATVGGKTGTGTLTVTKAEPVATTITGTTEGAGLKQAFTIPVNDSNDTAKAYAVTVKDQYGTEMTSAPVTWTISPAIAGVSVASDGTVTVTKAAAAGITTSQEFTLTAKDASNNETSTPITVARAASAATTVKLYKDGTELNGTDTVIIPTSNTPNTYTYTAKVFDQYDTEMLGVTPTLAFAAEDDYVTYNNGTVSVANGATPNETYTLTASCEGLEPMVITLTAKDIEITEPTVTPVSATYGMTWAQIVPESAITGGTAKLNGEDVSGAFYLKTSGTPTVGEQDYEVWFKSTDGAYDVLAKSGKVTVAAKPITATVTAVSKTYGEANPSFDFTLADGALVGSDTKEGLGLALSCEATATSGVGTYNVTGTASNKNYDVTVAGTDALTITAKTLTDAMVGEIEAQTYSKEAKTPAVTVTDSAAAITTDDYTVTYTNNTNAGTATATVTGKGNYTGKVDKSFTIAPKAVTVSGITAENRNYDGSSTVTLVYSAVVFDGLETGDTLTVTATGKMDDANVGTGKNVAISELTLGGASKDNYVLAAEGQQSTTTVDIAKQPAAPLSVTAANAAYTGLPYAGTNLTPSRSADAVEYTYYADNSGVKGEALEGAPTNVGTYWVVGSIDESENIAAAVADAVKFQITKAPLTITAEDNTITYGGGPANNGVEYVGFVNDETESVLTAPVAYEYSYEQFGNVGEYVITVKSAAADNYEITFVAGTLTVAQKEVGLDWSCEDNASFYYNGKAQSVTAEATGMVNGDALTVTVVSGAQTAIGSYTVKATALTGAKAANYTLPETKSLRYSIVAALTSVTVTQETVTAEVDNSTLTVKLSGYVDEGTTPTIEGYTIEDGKITVSGVEYTVDTSAVVVKPAYVEIAAAVSTVDTDNVVNTSNKSEDEQEAVKTVTNSTENTIENVTEAAAQTIVEEAKKASETLDSKLTEQQRTDLGEDITIEANIVVSITPTDIDFTSEKKIMNLNITPEIQLKAKGNGHTVDLDSVPVEELATWTLVKVQIPESFKPTVAKHTHGNVTEWLKVTVVKENVKYFATWYQKSFSDVELAEDGRTATVDFIFADEHGETKAYAAADVNVALPTDSKSGNTFKGWAFFVDGSETAVAGGPFTTMTDALLTALNAGTSVSAEGVFEPIQSYFGGDSVYSVKVSAAEHGAVTVSASSAYAGGTVTLNIKPEKGFTLETLTVSDKSGKEITTTRVKKNVYTFTMPGSDVTVKATFMEDNSMLNFFVDVPASAYYYDAVLWAAENEITNGVDDLHFGPDAECTRAQTVTFLWRAAGCPTVSGVSNPFTDVNEDAYYYEAVLWAVKENITDGTSATTFSPDATVTRAETVTFLYRAAKGRAATVSNPFTDVETGSYYGAAVLWAVKEGITDGTSATTFSPADNCVRGQMVTFLYRCFAEEE